MYKDPEGTILVITLIAITLLAGGIAAVLGQVLVNSLNGDALFADANIAFTKGVISAGVALLHPIAGVFTFSILTQVVNYINDGNINETGFVFDVLIGLATLGVTNMLKIKINSGWITNLKFENIVKNIFDGKIVNYAITNFAMEVGIDGSTTILEYIYKEIQDIIRREHSCPLMPHPIQFR
ncbi:MAG: hypothetical protein ABII85_01285 [Bacillota bacterium]